MRRWGVLWVIAGQFALKHACAVNIDRAVRAVDTFGRVGFYIMAKASISRAVKAASKWQLIVKNSVMLKLQSGKAKPVSGLG